ncbi:hypothetical protein G6F70_004753 [Rhizopus microsporus]|nr:hypothetical protein G6F70_004753 [Rhizopus microsporus]KAG1206945.1 hypothetical protein G6F69_008444 [Rhizopus microsporus]KAG1227546.1 hypothetical protein G6F67_008385 [Rhizopus microsporus]KAG1265257.1 hypothetical protein G6F68_003732 [Rhizopus microsporus]
MSYAYDQNPWQEQNGPRYGNAYEDNSTGNYGNAYEQPQMNMPMPGFSATGYNNAWTESNKTEYDSVPPQNVTPHNAYQYSGTPYGNQPQNTGGAYSNIPAETIPTEPNKANNESTSPPTNEKHRSSNQGRFWLSLITLLASIGHLGFAAGARPVSDKLNQVKVLQTFQTKSWKNWKTARPSIYKRTSKNLLKGPPRYEDIEWTNNAVYNRADRLIIAERAVSGHYEEL